MINNLRIAWAAGFTDGEGYIGIVRMFDKVRGYYTYRPHFEVAQVHAEPIDLMQSMFPGIGQVRHQKNNKRGYWTWRVSGHDAINVVKVLLPYLVVKDEQARLLIEYEFTDRRIWGDGRFRKNPAEVTERRASLWAAICELNGGRALQAERLSEKAPLINTEGDAIVRPHGNENHENAAEMPASDQIH